MSRGLVGHHVWYDATPHQLWIYLSGIADEPDGEGLTLIDSLSYLMQRLIKRACYLIAITCL